jgi:uroporphyrinogen decarboxylase
MMARYDANDPARIACDQTTLEALRDRDYVWTVAFSGPFWQVREWVGFESLCTMLIDEPAWVAEMIDFWKEYVATLLRRLLTMAVPDHVHVSEDMAYKRFAMISPTMAREFLLPTWRYWCDILRGAGVRVVGMDSDGFIGELIPLWIDAGFTMCDPIEVAAGNDIVEFRRQFGRSMAYRGGIDKREIAKGGSAIDAEIRRIEPVIRSGGFIPSCDHGVPADVSWQAWLDYCHALAKTTGWL